LTVFIIFKTLLSRPKFRRHPSLGNPSLHSFIETRENSKETWQPYITASFVLALALMTDASFSTPNHEEIRSYFISHEQGPDFDDVKICKKCSIK
jgi:hypothetical protein